ncbi:cytochrome P450 71B25 [Massariosphaeria phaeospora]|uniref:Cytochrome P450 71B25 n=1 Tax=Massariosphaeria phaeospora TaxID=100035 RepID=A0A7C8IE47_9PLEO|nr:cytochrome P450 71B25 [Massariosphaeria phaeospora]
MAPWSGLPLALVIVLGGYVLYGCVKMIRARRAFYYSKVKPGLPMPKWSPIFGHLLAMKSAFDKYKLPQDITRANIFTAMAQEFSESDLWYMDLWPFFNPLLLVNSLSYATQTCSHENNLGKPPDLEPFMRAIAGGDSVFTTNGEEWKHGRDVFTSGFNTNYILGQTGHIVQEAEEYVEVLRKLAKSGEMVCIDQVNVKYTMDIGGILTLNQRFNTQAEDANRFVSAIRHTINWDYLGELRTPLVRWTPLIRLIHWYNGRIMKNYISRALDARYIEWKAGNVDPQTTRTAIDLALADYINRHKDKPTETLDPKFKAWAIVQLRLLFFVAHDSTSATLSYTYLMLSKHPAVLAKLRSEHDLVFGTDLSRVPTLLKDQPHLLNKLEYTTAVIKEVLRLYPPASGFRLGRPDVHLHDDAGNSYPTDNTRIWVLHSALHVHAKYWEQPDAFLPQRWLVGPEDPLYPVKGAWRPFEFGPRNCLGQTLSMLDLRVTLAMVVRRFDFEEAYGEWDRVNGVSRERWVKGERWYQVGGGGAHPADGLPCRVVLRE